MVKYPFLYRALRTLEIEEGFNLIPKATDAFKSDPMLGIDTVFPFSFGSVENIVRQHQWKQYGWPTRGISSTPYYDRALFYAAKNKVIVRIDTSKFIDFGITTYDVNSILGHRANDIAVPEDNEIILVYQNDGLFPKEIIVEVINLP